MIIPLAQKEITFVILATNGYLPLGIRFIRNMNHFCQESHQVSYVLGTDNMNLDPKLIGPRVTLIPMANNSWVEGTNSKFRLVSRACYLLNSPNPGKLRYVFYVDADTEVDKPVKLRELVREPFIGGQHFNNKGKEPLPFDRNPISTAYVSPEYKGPYVYGAFFGGTIGRMIDFCNTCEWAQKQDVNILYEPGVQDESYINAYFAKEAISGRPIYTLTSEDFPFVISDKGGLQNLRDSSIKYAGLTENVMSHEGPFKIINGQIVSF